MLNATVPSLLCDVVPAFPLHLLDLGNRRSRRRDVVLAMVGWMRGGIALIAIVTLGLGIAWFEISRLELRLDGPRDLR